MKKLTLFIILLFPFFSQAQFKDNKKTWTKVEQFELKDLPKSALAEVEGIYKKAKRANNVPQQIKCFMYQAKFSLVLEEDAQLKVIDRLKETIKTSKKPTTNILESLLAELYTQYYVQHSYQFKNRTKTDEKVDAYDFRTWDLETIFLEIHKHYQKSLENSETLQNTQITTYKDIIYIGSDVKYRPTLYDFLAHRALNFYKDSFIELPQANYRFEIADADLLAETDTFINYNFNTKDQYSKSYNALLIYQDVLGFHKTTQNIDALLFLESERLSYVYTNAVFDDETAIYFETLQTLINKHKTHEASTLLQFDWANYNYMYGDDVKEYPWETKKAFEIATDAMLRYPNSLGAMQCKQLVERILHKELTLKMETYTPKNQAKLLYVSYKNIPEIHLNIYKPTDRIWNELNKIEYSEDSLELAIIRKSKLIQSWSEKLPNLGDYHKHSTELAIPALDYGKYIMVVSHKAIDSAEPDEVETQVFQVTNLVLVKSSDKKQQVMQVLDRLTGAPVPDVDISFEIRGRNYKTKTIHLGTNTDGYAYYNTPDDYYYSSKDIEISTANDFAFFGDKYNQAIFKGRIPAHTAKNMYLFTDRSIYRPGQKVFYKGILTKTKDLKTEVFTDKKGIITLYNANREKVKTIDFTTNDFGSFFGEFTLPDIGVNGRFRLQAIVDYGLKKSIYQSSYFQVEEYKRPKFEAKFKTLEKTYRVNDTVKVTGLATAFSGAKITDAKVVYTVKRNVQYPRWYYWYYPDYSSAAQEIIHDETITNGDGEFTIDFKAIPDLEVDKESLPKFSYEINADITDVNGETHSTSTTVYVGYHTTEVTVTTGQAKLDKDKTDNKLTIYTRNLNGGFVPANGTIKIYKLQAPKLVYAPRPWTAPDLPKFTETEFHQKFPYTPYTDEDELNNWKDAALFFESNFKTEKEAKELALGAMNDWQSGKYHLVLETKDRFDNLIKEEIRFDVYSNADKTLADKQLFDIRKDKDSYELFDTVSIDFASAAEDFWLNVWVEKKNYIYKQAYHLTNSKKTIKIPVNESDSGGFSVHYYWSNRNTSGSGSLQILVPYKPHFLEIETKTFRDKLLPGQEETWEFILKGNGKEKVAAEMLANMYDASLDDLYSGNSYWMNPLHRPTFYWNRSFRLNDNYDTDSFSISFPNSGSFPSIKVSTINWYGFSLDNYYNNNYYYLKELKEKRRRQKLSASSKFEGSAGQICGIVSDDMGPIPGASVLIKGTEYGTVTDFDGKYCISAVRGDVLVFSMAGNVTEKTVEKTNIIDVVIDVQELEAVTIIARGFSRKPRSLGYSSQLVESDGISTALSGKVAGIQVNGNSNGRVFIRGVSSLTGNATLLYIIDGVVMPASKVDMDNVGSVSVLKGAAATALYGMRAANGVVIITTKNGLMATQTISPEEQALLLKVKARKNFNETAFFLPTLRTNKKGEIRFSFTMPEALTTWKLQLLAHTKDLKVGTKTLSTVTQKDLMVIPNVPRFLREGDSIVISSKITNLTPEKGTCFAQLVLTNALDGKSIDKALANTNATKNFNVDAKGNTSVSWKLFIPKGTEAVQWKVVAKMGKFTDGEQNVLPVLSNRMLVTESMAMWVKQGQTKIFSLDKLKNNSSNTLTNHKLTLEITSNPAWYAVQSLPYLMEYPHECAEQTFSRYYANALATHIANSNPKIQEVFSKWENTDALLSNLEKNQDLKNIIIQETPWLRDAQSESEQKKRIGLLFNLDKMSRELKRAANKLSRMQHSNGGFPWFKGSRYESRYITQHVASGFGHLKQLGVANFSPKTDKMLNKAVDYLDNKFIEDYQELLKNSHKIVVKAKKKDKVQAKLDSVTYLAENHLGNTQMHYLYMRSFYKDKATTKALDEAINYYTNQTVEYWQEANVSYWSDKRIYSRGLMALYLHRGKHQELAKEIVKSLDENSITNEEMGMYWKSNRAGYYWYQAPIETQALMIEVFSEIDKNLDKINNLKLWLLKNKQTTQWKTTKATTEAIYALLLQGSDWLSVDETVAVQVGNQTIDPNKMPDVKAEAGTGYFKKSWKKEEIKPEMAQVTLTKKAAGVAWGGLYWQYFEDMDKITQATDGKQTPLFLTKKVFLKKNTDTGEALTLIDENTALKVGDLVRIRIELRADRKMEFIHMKDMRAAGLEPVNVISQYKWQDGLGYYESTKDASTNFFISRLPIGVYVFEYDLRVNNAGNFSNGITTIQSMYAPEFSSHSEGIRLKVD